MHSPNHPTRPRYRPSGKFKLLRLIVGIDLLLVLSAAIAAGAYLALITGMYLVVMGQVFAVALLAWATYRLVLAAHLRNPLLAAALGGLCGLAAYLGYFHADHCLRWGAPVAAIDRLPSYITFRMETDFLLWHGECPTLVPTAPAAGIVPQRPLAQVNLLTVKWGVFAVELLLLSGTAALVGWTTALRPYSEKCGQWLHEAKLALSVASGNALEQALCEWTVPRWAESKVQIISEHELHANITLWFVPASAGGKLDGDVFITLGDGPRELLTAEEVAALVPNFPALQEIDGTSQEQLAAEAEELADENSARIWKVPDPYAGQVQNPRNRFWWQLLVRGGQLAPLALVPGLVSASVGLGWLLAIKLALLPEWCIIGLVIGTGLFCLVAVRYWYDPDRPVWMRLGRWFHQRLLLKAIASRPDPLVAAGDPAAITAEMCPRKTWLLGGDSPCEDSNLGLMLLDEQQRALIFEGDYERYWIPADAILAARIERIPIGQPTTASMYGVVLQIRLAKTTWELPLFPLEGIEGPNRWERAVRFLARLEQLCRRSFAGELSSPPEPAPVGAHG